ncbi:uridine diphosphate glucose pyrophosphatase NUDT14 isoform X2 [Dromaius novaehollandiae]|uniref:uridine diphosphate glucose pyrophosphatase NUDT14 isoform X2 n=1 Tax=Dromaius novaehollandiae TaxID=8790 RepID=UPI00311F546F
MEAIEELVIQPCASSLYLRPFRLCYRQNGTKKVWDCMRTHDSVSILIFNTSRQCFVVVKQFRPDKPDLSLEEVAREEILEECGYCVPATDLRKITSYRSGVGVTGSRHTLFYAEITDQMKTGKGGGQPEEGELIEVVEIPLEDSMKFAFDESLPKTPGVIFGFVWFQNNIAPKLPKK